MFIRQLYIYTYIHIIHIMYCQHISKHPQKQTVQPWFETILGGQKSFHKDPVGVPKDRRHPSRPLLNGHFKYDLSFNTSQLFLQTHTSQPSQSYRMCLFKPSSFCNGLRMKPTSTSLSRGKDLLWRLWSRSGRCHPAMSNARNEALGPRISDAEMTKDLVIVGSSSSLGYPLVNVYITMENHYF